MWAEDLKQEYHLEGPYPQNICEGVITNAHFKVAVRNFDVDKYCKQVFPSEMLVITMSTVVR